MVALRLRNGTFVYGTNPKVKFCAFISRFECLSNSSGYLIDKWQPILHTGTQHHLAVCEEDSIYVIRAKFCAFYAESSYENMIWRKHKSTVSFHLNTCVTLIVFVLISPPPKNWNIFFFHLFLILLVLSSRLLISWSNTHRKWFGMESNGWDCTSLDIPSWWIPSVQLNATNCSLLRQLTNDQTEIYFDWD